MEYVLQARMPEDYAVPGQQIPIGQAEIHRQVEISMIYRWILRVDYRRRNDESIVYIRNSHFSLYTHKLHLWFLISTSRWKIVLDFLIFLVNVPTLAYCNFKDNYNTNISRRDIVGFHNADIY